MEADEAGSATANSILRVRAELGVGMVAQRDAEGEQGSAVAVLGPRAVEPGAVRVAEVAEPPADRIEGVTHESQATATRSS